MEEVTGALPAISQEVSPDEATWRDESQPPVEVRALSELSGAGRPVMSGCNWQLVRACPGPPQASHVPAHLETRERQESEAGRPRQPHRLTGKARTTASQRHGDQEPDGVPVLHCGETDHHQECTAPRTRSSCGSEVSCYSQAQQSVSASSGLDSHLEPLGVKAI